MKAFKGFNLGLTCQGSKFEDGKTYEEPDAKLCSSGFHACEYPLDIFNYYPPALSEYREVELDSVSDERESSDTKVCGKRITIGAKLDIAGLVRAAVEYTFAHAKEVKGGRATGDQGAASATGTRGAASATGYQSIACAHGIEGTAKAALGNWIVLSEWVHDAETYKWTRIGVKAVQVDGETIKADVYYMLKNGEIVEA